MATVSMGSNVNSDMEISESIEHRRVPVQVQCSGASKSGDGMLKPLVEVALVKNSSRRRACSKAGCGAARRARAPCPWRWCPAGSASWNPRNPRNPRRPGWPDRAWCPRMRRCGLPSSLLSWAALRCGAGLRAGADALRAGVEAVCRAAAAGEGWPAARMVVLLGLGCARTREDPALARGSSCRTACVVDSALDGDLGVGNSLEDKVAVMPGNRRALLED
mmetsp:Transcript_10905/g.37058  ORF Transcript_10905/g.37058 Transcript_10905/m.37058 type:complete len:220 (+) Transcript_10905:1746-2405(+)